MSPPTQRSGAPPPSERPAPESEAATTPPGCIERNATDGVPQQLRRRRVASYRCPPLVDGRRDPLEPVHPDTWTDAELESWAAAAVHLRRAGLAPQVPDSVRRWYARRSCRCSCRGDAA